MNVNILLVTQYLRSRLQRAEHARTNPLDDIDRTFHLTSSSSRRCSTTTSQATSSSASLLSCRSVVNLLARTTRSFDSRYSYRSLITVYCEIPLVCTSAAHPCIVTNAREFPFVIIIKLQRTTLLILEILHLSMLKWV